MPMNKRLATYARKEKMTSPNEILVSKQPVPWLIRIELLVRIQQHWPLVPSDCNFAIRKLPAYSVSGVRILVSNGREQNRTYSASSQSRSAGQSSAPVTGWLKPRLVLTLRLSGGFKATSRGVIHSRTVPFKDLVSSDLALEIPFWSLNVNS